MAKIKHAQKLSGGGFGAWRRDWTSQLHMAFPDDFGLKTRWFLSKVQLWKDRDILCRGVCMNHCLC